MSAEECANDLERLAAAQDISKLPDMKRRIDRFTTAMREEKSNVAMQSDKLKEKLELAAQVAGPTAASELLEDCANYVGLKANGKAR